MHELGLVSRIDDLPLETARLLHELIPCDVSGWVVIDLGNARLSGVHWPDDRSRLMGLLPADLREVPLIEVISRRINRDVISISDIWSRRQWHSRRIYADVYHPNRAEYQLVTAISFADPANSGASLRRVESLSLIRSDRDFSPRDRAMLGEFSRHVRTAARRLRHSGFAPTLQDALARGLTARQGEVLIELAGGSSVRVAAARLGVSEKTAENHLQAAYQRLQVSNRVAALARISQRESGSFCLGVIPH